MEYDLLVKNGLVVDPSQRIEDIRDLAISQGKVIAVEPQIIGDAKQIIDARDKIVTPGLIDLHAHVYHAVTDNGVNADVHCLLHGVTTVVDGGSSGATNFQGFRQFIHELSQTRMFCFFNFYCNPPAHAERNVSMVTSRIFVLIRPCMIR